MLGDRAAALAAGLGVPLVAGARRESPIWTPAQCPRCAAGEALEPVEA